jgi:site-specific recombinase XerD
LLSNGACASNNLAWWSLSYVDVLTLRTGLETRLAPSTANAILSAVRCVLKECWRLRLMSAEEYQRATDVPHIKGESLPAGRALAESELMALLTTCRDDPAPAGIRDLAIMVLLAATGMRCNELAHLTIRDVDLASGTIKIRYGKGGRSRYSYVRDEAVLAVLSAWFAVRGDWNGFVVAKFDRGRHLIEAGLTADSIAGILSRRATEAGVRHCSPHDMRRTFASGIWRAGGDLEALRRLMGHAKLETTQRYLRDHDEAAIEAAALVKIPL